MLCFSFNTQHWTCLRVGFDASYGFWRFSLPVMRVYQSHYIVWIFYYQYCYAMKRFICIFFACFLSRLMWEADMVVSCIAVQSSDGENACRLYIHVNLLTHPNRSVLQVSCFKHWMAETFCIGPLQDANKTLCGWFESRSEIFVSWVDSYQGPQAFTFGSSSTKSETGPITKQNGFTPLTQTSRIAPKSINLSICQTLLLKPRIFSCWMKFVVLPVRLSLLK